METQIILPDLGGGRRFGAISFGYDRITTLREEFAVLAALASRVSGIAVEALTVQNVQAATVQYEAGLHALTSAYTTLAESGLEHPVIAEIGVILAGLTHRVSE